MAHQVTELLRQGRTKDVWDLCCGFIDLKFDQFMAVQERLLMEQIQLMSTCELGQKFLGQNPPRSVQEFRERVPLTTYADYAPYLLEQKTDALPVKDVVWMKTSGRTGPWGGKWIPWSSYVMKELTPASMVGMLIFGSCSERGEVVLAEGDKVLYLVAPPPYSSGLCGHYFLEAFPFRSLPPEEKAITMPFRQRIQDGFRLALTDGLDCFFGLASVLVRAAEEFANPSAQRRPKGIPNPKLLYRILKGTIRAKMAGRPLYPKDLWKLKAIFAAGTDTAAYTPKIEKYWGLKPIEAYVNTELGAISTQTWDYEDLTFFPQYCFYEFIPEDEHLKALRDPSYQPRTVLMNEVEVGKHYELVGTNFHGSVFMRYRPGDMITITAHRNDKLDIDIPQMVFRSRVDEIIDIAGFARLTERVMCMALEKADISYEDWVLAKEGVGNEATLHLYIELRGQSMEAEELGDRLHASLKKVDEDYRDTETMLGIRPLKVDLLPKGTSMRYLERKLAAGAEIGQLKPRRMNPPEDVVQSLLHTAEAEARA